MVEGFRNGNGQRLQLRVIRGGLGNKDPELAKLAKEVEPMVREGMEEARNLQDPRDKIRNMCILANLQAEVGEDAMPILKEAFEAADKLEDRFLSAELLLETADAFWTTDLDPLPAMARALEKVDKAEESVRKQEMLAEIAFEYAKLSESARAQIAVAKIRSPGFRDAVKGAIDELTSGA